MNDFSYLDNITYKNSIPFVPPIQFGKVVKVYDGDTITVATKLFENSQIYRFQVRLNGIDCPEMKTHNETEKQCAKLAKELITNTCLNQIVELRDVQLEKYGRVLAKVYCGTVCLNDLLCERHLAVAYDGGTKKCPENWMDYYNEVEQKL
jgi:endonuclease YncB( thermonuclease family)